MAFVSETHNGLLAFRQIFFRVGEFVGVFVVALTVLACDVVDDSRSAGPTRTPRRNRHITLSHECSNVQVQSMFIYDTISHSAHYRNAKGGALLIKLY